MKNMLEKLKRICINQYNFALNNVGRFIPPSLAHKYPRIKTPYMHAMYNHYGNRLTIDEIIERNTNHSIMIVGCGGSGKTYTLIEFAGKLLKSDMKTLPFYVPLNDFNFNTSSIVDYAAEQLSAEYEPNIKTCFMEWLRTDHDEKIIFLLDGFNEITSSEIQVRVLDEIKRLQSLYNCVRFVITSRYDMSSSLVSGAVSPFVSYAVDELSSETVKDYIKDFFENYGNVEDIIANAMISENDDTVKHFLRNPMALVMYCFMNCNDINELYIPHKDYRTTGELIENYVFLIKKINETQYAINEKASDFLRYVGYQMSNDGLFKISMRGLTQYAQEFNDIDIKQWLEVSYIKDMLKCSGNNHILSEIEFVHQNYRDFFAADYLKNILTEGNADRINKCFGDRNITSEVQILLGDILEEYKYVTKDIESGSSVIQDIITRNRHLLSPTAISMIIHIAAIARKNDLSSFDFSCVDLGSTTLNRIKLYMPGVGKAKFENSKIDKATFNALGHPGSVSSLLWLERRYIISFSKSGIFCFDMAIKKHYQIAEISKYAVRAAIPLAGKKQIITGNDFGEIILWNYEFDNETFRIEMRNTTVINGATIHDIIELNGKIYVSSQDGKLYIFTTADEGNYDLAILPNSSHQERYINTNCRLTAVDDILYLSYGDTLHIYKIMSQKNELILLESYTLDNAEIIDIAGVEAESRNGVLINLRKKSDNGDIVSQVMFYSFEKKYMEEIKSKTHSKGRVGFKGWNSFSVPYNNRVIYLTANIEDAVNVDAGLLKIYYPDDLMDQMQYSSVEYFGNNQSMSVNCAVPFCYNDKEYIATGSTERSVDILSNSGTSGTLLYHLIGHDNGIHYMHIVSDEKMYTAHYSGEISEWRYVNYKWRCNHVYAPHNNWVWETRCVSIGENSYVISCSYDNTLSVVNTRTEELVCLITEPTSRVLSFGFISENVILTGYSKQGKSVLCKYCIDYTGKKYYAGSEINLLNNYEAELRAIHTAPDKLLLCANDNKKGYLFCIDKKNDFPLDEIFITNTHIIEEEDLRVNLRCSDQIDYNGRTIIACGGDYHDNESRIGFYIRICEGFEKEISYKCKFNGCSTFKLIIHEENLYIVAGTYDKRVCVFLVDETGSFINPIVNDICLDDKILNIQIYGDNVFFSLLNGCVCAAKITDIINGSRRIEDLFSSLSGLRCCHVDFSASIINWDSDFKKLISYYGRVGK